MKSAASTRPVILLGPQREQPSVHSAVDALAPTGRVATVTAGWEEREAEDRELIEHLSRDTVNLGLFPRTEQVFEQDPELFRAMQARNDILRRQRELYGVRLAPALEVARSLMARRGTQAAVQDSADELLEREITSAIETVRHLDQHHFQAVCSVRAEFEDRWRPLERDAVASHRDELAQKLSDCSVLCIAGGHVGILLNRLRLFDVMGLIPELPIVAWAGGAMVLAQRIVLFHDSPPQGAGHAEVFQQGLGVIDGLVPLPHASRRLQLDDALRVSLFARRFSPALCPALDPGSRLDYADGTWSGPEVQCLAADGSMKPFVHQSPRAEVLS
ncbi:MAG: hypothetical protein ACI8QZ_000654 [Chlamydiales bacterium]|jgi:hypothetical protein